MEAETTEARCLLQGCGAWVCSVRDRELGVFKSVVKRREKMCFERHFWHQFEDELRDGRFYN